MPPNYIEFVTTSEVDCGHDAILGDLQDSAFTAEAWILADGFGGTATGRIFDKYLTGGWRFYIGLSGLGAEIDCVTQDAFSRSGYSYWNPYWYGWVHVAMTFDNAGTRKIRLWIAGVEPTSYQIENTASGLIVTDVSNDLIIGNKDGGSYGWNGKIGWCRVSDSLRYTSNFTPSPMCVLPDIDDNTVAQWIGVENNPIVTVDNQQGNSLADGTPSNCIYGRDCPGVDNPGTRLRGVRLG